MKLVYLWIESYHFINKRGFPLSSNYRVDFDETESVWKVEKKENLDSLLYGGNISVTAIVGDNGAGKSTLLDCIRLILFDKRNRKKISGFLIWEEEEELRVFCLMERVPHVEFKNHMVKVSKLLPENFNLIYYSDFLDLKYYSEEFDDGEDGYTYMDKVGTWFRNRESVQVNISTSHLLKEHNKIMDYFHSDIKKQMSYYGDVKEKGLPFLLPQHLSVKLEFLDIDRFDTVLDAPLDAYAYRGSGHHGEINTNAHIIGTLKVLQRIYEKKTILNVEPLDEKQVLQWNLWITFLYNLLSERKGSGNELHDYEDIDNILRQQLNNLLSEENVWIELERNFEYDRCEEFYIYFTFYNRMMYYIDTPKKGGFDVEFQLPETIKTPLMENVLWEYAKPERRYTVNYLDDAIINFPQTYMNMKGWNGKWKLEDFLEIYELYMRISYEIDFFKFSWGLSTGESNFFNLFARLHDGMKQEPKRKIILMFDELDSSFHPQWQQEIMMRLSNFLCSFYPQTEFQIFLTTHSPVLLSDIPRENVLFMKKDEAVVQEYGQTFAANIASLYYDSFFMKKGSIGEIAKHTIGNLLSVLTAFDNKEDVRNQQGLFLINFIQKQFPYMNERDIGRNACSMTTIQNLIDAIGEDIWRYKISEKYKRLFSSEEDVLVEEIRKELNLLEQKKGKGSVREFVKRYLEETER